MIKFLQNLLWPHTPEWNPVLNEKVSYLKAMSDRWNSLLDAAPEYTAIKVGDTVRSWICQSLKQKDDLRGLWIYKMPTAIVEMIFYNPETTVSRLIQIDPNENPTPDQVAAWLDRAAGGSK